MWHVFIKFCLLILFKDVLKLDNDKQQEFYVALDNLIFFYKTQETINFYRSWPYMDVAREIPRFGKVDLEDIDQRIPHSAIDSVLV